MSLLQMVLSCPSGRRAQLLPTDTPTYDLKWERSRREVSDFVRLEGHWPSVYATNPSEAFLGRWVNTQRTKIVSGKLSETREASFSSIGPGWQGRGERNRAWDDWLARVAHFYESTGAWPSMVAEDADEARMGNWLNNQKSQHRRGELPTVRSEALDAVFPDGWAGTTYVSQSWDEWLAQVRRIREETGFFPRSVSSSVEEERKAGKWLERQTRKFKRDELSASEVESLDREIPGWSDRPKGRRRAQLIARQ